MQAFLSVAQGGICAADLCPPLRPVRICGTALHPSAAGVLSELLGMAGLEAALAVLHGDPFLRQLQVPRRRLLLPPCEFVPAIGWTWFLKH